MRYPNTYSATELKHWSVLEEYEPGRWRPARPCSCRSGGLWRRIKIAWWVFTGKWDAIHWGNHSGEWSNDEVNYRDVTHPEWKQTKITG